jgi:hypothetical protein
VFRALDNLSSADDSLAVGNGYFVHIRRFYSHLAGIGYCRGIDTRHSRAKPNLASAVACVDPSVF